MHTLLLLFLNFILSLHVFALNSKSKNTLEVRGDYWCPYNCSSSSDKKGYIVDILDIIFKKHNIKINYVELNWARSIAETREGKYDSIIGAAKSDAPDFIFPKQFVGHARTCFYTKPSSTWTFTDVESLKSVKLGVVKDYAYSNEIDAYIKDSKNEHNL